MEGSSRINPPKFFGPSPRTVELRIEATADPRNRIGQPGEDSGCALRSWVCIVAVHVFVRHCLKMQGAESAQPSHGTASFNGSATVRLGTGGSGSGSGASGGGGAAGAGGGSGAGHGAQSGAGAGAGAGVGSNGAGGGFSAAGGDSAGRPPASKRPRGQSNASEGRFGDGSYYEGDFGDDAQSTAAASTTSSVPVLSPPLGHHPVAPAGLIPAFLKKTYDMLETEELHKYVWWGPEGDTIVIKKVRAVVYAAVCGCAAVLCLTRDAVAPDCRFWQHGTATLLQASQLRLVCAPVEHLWVQKGSV